MIKKKERATHLKKQLHQHYETNIKHNIKRKKIETRQKKQIGDDKQQKKEKP